MRVQSTIASVMVLSTTARAHDNKVKLNHLITNLNKNPMAFAHNTFGYKIPAEHKLKLLKDSQDDLCEIMDIVKREIQLNKHNYTMLEQNIKYNATESYD